MERWPRFAPRSSRSSRCFESGSGSRSRSIAGSPHAGVPVPLRAATRPYLRPLAPGASVERVYTGADLLLFQPPPRIPAPAPPLLLFVGRMVEKKGLPDLLSATAHLRRSGVPARCRLVGAGPLEAELRETARRLGIDGAVEIFPPASQEEVARVHLPAASVLVMPFVIAPDGDRDGLPTTLLEAMARGVPVVSSRLPGIPEAVPEGEAGLLAGPGDVGGLAAATRGAAAGR